LLRGGGRIERPAMLSVGDLHLDTGTKQVRRGGTLIGLTAKEHALLEYFMRCPGRVLSRADLLEHVWDFAFDGDPHVVAVYVGYLRGKIDKPFDRRSLETVRGMGYRLHDERAASAGGPVPLRGHRGVHPTGATAVGAQSPDVRSAEA